MSEASEQARANDRAEGPVHAQADVTLGGYLKEHNRPPAFEGLDGEPYTVSAEVEQTPNLLAPYEGYLVFFRVGPPQVSGWWGTSRPRPCRGASAEKRSSASSSRSPSGGSSSSSTRRSARLTPLR